MKGLFSLRTVRKKVLMLSKLAGIALIFSYILSTGLPVSRDASFLIWLGFVLLLILGIDFFMQRFITKPIGKLNASAKRLAGLDFSAPCDLVSTDEFGELSASLNKMSENLQQALARLEDANTQLERDVEKERLLLAERKELVEIIMLLFIAVPLVCALIGVSGPLAVICDLVPSQPAFDGLMALSAGSIGTAVKDIGILAVHCIAWSALYVLISSRHKKQPV